MNCPKSQALNYFMYIFSNFSTMGQRLVVFPTRNRGVVYWLEIMPITQQN